MLGDNKRPLKIDPGKTEQSIFVGFKPNSNTYLVYIPSQNKIVPSGDVRFDEDREDSLQPSFAISDETEISNDLDSIPSKSTKEKSICADIFSLSNDDFIKAARKNLGNFQRGSEVSRP